MRVRVCVLALSLRAHVRAHPPTSAHPPSHPTIHTHTHTVPKPRAMNHHSLFDHLLSLPFVFQVWMKTIPKSSSASGLSATLSPGSGMPSFGCCENLSLLQLFTGNSRLTCFQTSDCTIINIFVFSLFMFSVVYHLEKRPSKYVPQAGLFHGCLDALQTDNHQNHHYHHFDQYKCTQLSETAKNYLLI